MPPQPSTSKNPLSSTIFSFGHKLGVKHSGWNQQDCGLLGSIRSHGRAIDPAEADTFRVLFVQGFEGVAVEEGYDGAGEVGEGR